MDHVMSESYNKATILQTLRNYRKMTISWSFTYNSFVKVHGKIIGRHNMNVLYPDSCYRGTALYHIIYSVGQGLINHCSREILSENEP